VDGQIPVLGRFSFPFFYSLQSLTYLSHNNNVVLLNIYNIFNNCRGKRGEKRKKKGEMPVPRKARHRGLVSAVITSS